MSEETVERRICGITLNVDKVPSFKPTEGGGLHSRRFYEMEGGVGCCAVSAEREQRFREIAEARGISLEELLRELVAIVP